MFYSLWLKEVWKPEILFYSKIWKIKWRLLNFMLPRHIFQSLQFDKQFMEKLEGD